MLTKMLENKEDPATILFKKLKNPKEKGNITELTCENKTIHDIDSIYSEFLNHFKEKFSDNSKKEERSI